MLLYFPPALFVRLTIHMLHNLIKHSSKLLLSIPLNSQLQKTSTQTRKVFEMHVTPEYTEHCLFFAWVSLS